MVTMGDAKSNTDARRIELIKTKHVTGFFCLFVLIYVPLMVPWPGLATAYSRLYRTGAAFLFEPLTPEGVVQFHPLSNAEDDIKIAFYKKVPEGPDGKMTTVGFIRCNSRRSGYMYIAFVTALIIATPIPFRRKGWALLWGMILIHGYIIFRLAIWIIYGFNKEPLSIIVLSPFWQRVLLLTIDVSVRNMTFGFIVCVFIWILVSFRREDWSRILIHASKVASHKNTSRQ